MSSWGAFSVWYVDVKLMMHQWFIDAEPSDERVEQRYKCTSAYKRAHACCTGKPLLRENDSHLLITSGDGTEWLGMARENQATQHTIKIYTPV
eukprot:1144542-Pelagomonas_calceolata.AAC.1